MRKNGKWNRGEEEIKIGGRVKGISEETRKTGWRKK